MNIVLSEAVTEDERLARVICASSKPKNYKKTAFYFDDEEDRNIVVTSQFIDTRNPAELSVNRISTLKLEKAHQLGINHQKEKQPSLTYHGFAEITAKLCFDNDCKVIKDDLGGANPYHANIVYPYAQGLKEDNQEIAVQLAHHAKFTKYDNTL